MKIKRWPFVLALGFVALVGLAVYGLTSTARGFLSTIELKAPASAVVDYQYQGSLTGDQDLVLLRLPPAQIPAFLRQLQRKPEFRIGPYRSTLASSNVVHDPWVARFFKAVPRGAQGGSFRVDHDKGDKNEWPTLCDFAVDRAMGRVWIYGWSVYN